MLNYIHLHSVKNVKFSVQYFLLKILRLQHHTFAVKSEGSLAIIVISGYFLI